MKKLSPLQKRILGEITWDSRLSHEELARRLRIKPHTARRTVRFLDELLGFKPRCWSNPFLQGCWSCRVYFSADTSDTKRIKHLTTFISSMPEVIWFASLMGDFRFAMALRGSGGLHHFSEMFDRIDQQFGDIITHKVISNITEFVYFIPWIAHPGTRKRKQMWIRSSAERSSLDELDRRIIDTMHATPLASMSTLARCLGIPATTARYRFDRLVESGVFIAFGLAYDDRRAGLEGFLISISTRGLGGILFNSLKEYARDNPHVLWIGRFLGNWDIEIGVELEDSAALNEILSGIHTLGGGSIHHISVHTLGQTHKG